MQRYLDFIQMATVGPGLRLDEIVIRDGSPPVVAFGRRSGLETIEAVDGAVVTQAGVTVDS